MTWRSGHFSSSASVNRFVTSVCLSVDGTKSFVTLLK